MDMCSLLCEMDLTMRFITGDRDEAERFGTRDDVEEGTTLGERWEREWEWGWGCNNTYKTNNEHML